MFTVPQRNNTFSPIFNISEKTEPFYDEFIEKQLLAGNIPSRQLSFTLVSVTVTLLAADHGKMLPAPVIQTSSSTELHAVSSQLSLQSIQEQDVSTCTYFVSASVLRSKGHLFVP